MDISNTKNYGQIPAPASSHDDSRELVEFYSYLFEDESDGSIDTDDYWYIEKAGKKDAIL